MAALSVPVPQLQYDPPGAAAQLEKQVNVSLPDVTYADGQAATQDQLQKIGAFVYRVATLGGSEEIWNDAEQAWQPAATDAAALATLTPIALAFKAGEAAPWQGMLVAAGQKDKQGAPRYAKAINGQPVYRLRAFAQFTRDGATATGVSAPTADLSFVSAIDNQRFGISFDTETAADCTLARLQIKHPGLQPAGFVELRAAGPEIEIANCDAGGQPIARVLLTASGDIELHPAAGRKVIVQGDLEAERVRYLPAGGAVKQDLI
ncbi:MAG TPA: hypothetical protein VKD43_06325 [Xanthobacteraceae bacterium]|nr:hypothetical protein [Xanthobacteraceae bacterium]